MTMDHEVYRVGLTRDGFYSIATPAGNLVYTTGGDLYLTADAAEAAAVVQYLSQPDYPRRG